MAHLDFDLADHDAEDGWVQGGICTLPGLQIRLIAGVQTRAQSTHRKGCGARARVGMHMTHTKSTVLLPMSSITNNRCSSSIDMSSRVES